MVSSSFPPAYWANCVGDRLSKPAAPVPDLSPTTTESAVVHSGRRRPFLPTAFSPRPADVRSRPAMLLPLFVLSALLLVDPATWKCCPAGPAFPARHPTIARLLPQTIYTNVARCVKQAVLFRYNLLSVRPNVIFVENGLPVPIGSPAGGNVGTRAENPAISISSSRISISNARPATAYASARWRGSCPARRAGRSSWSATASRSKPRADVATTIQIYCGLRSQ